MGKSGNPAKAAQAEPVEYDPTPVDDDGVEDFDAFWDAQERTGRRVKIMGQVVELPPALPLQFELEARKLARSKRDKDVRKLVSVLFGKDALETWAAAGMDGEQFQLLLAWAPQVIAGEDVSMAEVAAKLAEAEAKGDESGEA